MTEFITKNGKKIAIVTVVISVVLVAFVGILFSDDGQSDSYDFTIPSLSVVSQGQEITDIVCNVHLELTEIDSLGIIIDVIKTRTFSGNPTLDITDVQTGKKSAGWVASPYASCSGGADIEITNSMYAEWETRNTIQGTWETVDFDFKANDRKVVTSTIPKRINFFSVYADDVEKHHRTGGIKELRVSVQGVLILNYVGFDNPKYHFFTPDMIIQTTFNIVLPESVQDPDTIDTDGDGIIDKFDKCKNSRETFNGFEDSDGCPDNSPIDIFNVFKDSDGDGVIDSEDGCPFQKETYNGFEDGDGCPDAITSVSPEDIVKPEIINTTIDQIKNIIFPIDTDFDGIPDVVDDCPTQKETFNGIKDFDGCPDENITSFTFQGEKIGEIELVSPIQVRLPPVPIVAFNELIQRIVSLFTG